MRDATPQRPFTGWHLLAIMVCFFGTIIAVNITMAIIAGQSWTGLIVKNSYVASQKYNTVLADAKAQASRGWQSDITYENGSFSLSLLNADGKPIKADHVELKIGRPAFEQMDHTVPLGRTADGNFSARDSLETGIWSITIKARKKDATYRRDLRLYVSGDGKGIIQ